MSVVLDNDLELITDLDFDVEEPCEQQRPECDDSAEWKLYLSCCGIPYYFCNNHKVKNMELFERDTIVHCKKCEALNVTLLHVERIKG